MPESNGFNLISAGIHCRGKIFDQRLTYYVRSSLINGDPIPN